MNKSLSLSIALLLMASGWGGAFLLAANPVVNQGYWVLPALVIGAGIGLCLRSVSGRKTALLLTVTAAIGLSSFNTLFPESRINTGAIRRLFSGNYSSSQPHLLQVPDRLQVPPFDQPLALVSPLSLDLSLFARFATGVTDFCFSPQGDLYASLPALGAVYRQQPGAGVAPAKISLFLQKLDTPSGLLCTDNRLLVAERSQVRAFSYVDKSDSVLMRMPSIEAGHLDHQLLNSPQGLLVSVGSRCDACQEADSLRATVQLLASQGRLQPSSPPGCVI